jgi:hypothetical protein
MRPRERVDAEVIHAATSSRCLNLDRGGSLSGEVWMLDQVDR